ncbi:MAG: hypothetical protein ACREOB_04105 [Thermodesulfobacteriota bacterium]
MKVRAKMKRSVKGLFVAGVVLCVMGLVICIAARPSFHHIIEIFVAMLLMVGGLFIFSIGLIKHRGRGGKVGWGMCVVSGLVLVWYISRYISALV